MADPDRVSPQARKKVNFTLRIEGTSDRHWLDWAESVARHLKAELNERSEESDFPQDITVEVEDGGSR